MTLLEAHRQHFGLGDDEAVSINKDQRIIIVADEVTRPVRASAELLNARGLRVIKHSCGSNRGLLDYFVEIGYDCYQSIQPTAGMDVCEIKQSHGDKLALWGGVGVEHLVSGTPEQVREDVRRAIACAKPGGGFILGSSHSIAVGTKYENFMALLDRFDKWTSGSVNH